MTRGRSIALVLGIATFTAGLALAEEPQRPTSDEANRKYLAEIRKAIEGHEDEPAEKVFKDVKTFKGWTAERLLGVMENGFSPALGVKCTFCHTDGDWIGNSERKTVARGMWAMMIDTNRRIREITWGEGSVNCYTCHRGTTAPATSPEETDTR